MDIVREINNTFGDITYKNVTNMKKKLKNIIVYKMIFYTNTIRY